MLDSCIINTVDEYDVLNKISIKPNPFRSSVTIEYKIKQPERITLTIYNQMGKQVYQVQENQPQGKQQFIWNAERIPDGVYFCVLKTESGKRTMKMIKLNH